MKGRVYIVGAGPGDPALLTVRAAELLAKANVVIYDRLVTPEILGLANRSAKMVYAGKDVGERGVQDRINTRMVSEAAKGRTVVRLKGGDPMIFGRGGEEAEFLARNSIEYEIVPGISSATGGPTYAGIPLTHRRYSSSVIILAGRSALERKSPADWVSIIRAAETIVILMGAGASSQIGERLLSAGLKSDTPVAVIERATTRRQRTKLITLGSLAEGALSIQSPSVIVVGAVARLAKTLDWFRIDGETTLEGPRKRERRGRSPRGPSTNS